MTLPPCDTISMEINIIDIRQWRSYGSLGDIYFGSVPGINFCTFSGPGYAHYSIATKIYGGLI